MIWVLTVLLLLQTLLSQQIAHAQTADSFPSNRTGTPYHTHPHASVFTKHFNETKILFPDCDDEPQLVKAKQCVDSKTHEIVALDN